MVDTLPGYGIEKLGTDSPRLPDERLPDERLPDERLPDERLADERLADERLADERLADERGEFHHAVLDSRHKDGAVLDSLLRLILRYWKYS